MPDRAPRKSAFFGPRKHAFPYEGKVAERRAEQARSDEVEKQRFKRSRANGDGSLWRSLKMDFSFIYMDFSCCLKAFRAPRRTVPVGLLTAPQAYHCRFAGSARRDKEVFHRTTVRRASAHIKQNSRPIKRQSAVITRFVNGKTGI